MNSENLQERLEQCRKDKAAIETLEKELEKQIEKERELKFGDVVTCPYGNRIMLYNSCGDLRAVNKIGDDVGSADAGFYKRTGINIFGSNLFNLDT